MPEMKEVDNEQDRFGDGLESQPDPILTGPCHP